MTSPLALLLIALVRAYQRFVSPLVRAAMGPVCRFEPSCSHYAVACLAGHGAWRGGLLSFVRVCKCHPFHVGGHDPPPPPRSPPPPASDRRLRRGPFVAAPSHALDAPSPAAPDALPASPPP